MKSGFIYLWFDKKRKKFYLGSHLGSIDDGYLGSNKRFQSSYKSRPDTFKRRILETFKSISSKELLQKEQNWLNLIKPEELSVRYYNEKNLATGGNIVGNLSEEKKKQHSLKCGIASKNYWNNIPSEEYQKRQKNCFGGNNFDRTYLKQRNKKLCSRTAKIIFPDGKTKYITNVAEFCNENNLNYGNFKTILRGNTNRKTCKGFTGEYV